MQPRQALSPLRYPGGKSRVASRIAKLLPNFSEFREPFVGGGSVFLELAKLRPDATYWLNDLYPDVANFWEVAHKNLEALVSHVKIFRSAETDGRKLYSFIRSLESGDPAQRAARFFILNRITFSGTSDSGGYSQQAFENRLTNTAIDRLENLSFISNLKVKVTNTDYALPAQTPGAGVVLFMDPPYVTKAQKLYGKGGNLHRTFDHERFAQTILDVNHHWLITYNDGASIKQLFPESGTVSHLSWQQHYPMKNALGPRVPKGEELLIANFELAGDKF